MQMMEINLSLMSEAIKQAIESGDVAIMEIVGDSMYPTIKHGGMIMIDRSCTEIVNDYAYAFEKEGLYDGYNGNTFCKRLRIEEGRVLIISENAKYETITFNDPNEIKVLGKVLAYKSNGCEWQEVSNCYTVQFYIPVYTHEDIIKKMANNKKIA